jgi:hypothetical protein
MNKPRMISAIPVNKVANEKSVNQRPFQRTTHRL